VTSDLDFNVGFFEVEYLKNGVFCDKVAIAHLPISNGTMFSDLD